MNYDRITHRYVDLFVEPLKKVFPQPVEFYRPDNKEGLFAKRTQPLGYWLGHVAAWITLITPASLVLAVYLLFFQKE